MPADTEQTTMPDADADGDASRTVRVGEVADGPLAAGTPGDAVALPVESLLTGRGFITGKSGSGKSNTASVIIERLLDESFPVLIVDTDGEYYGLKESYEVLHVGADEECDIQVGPEHAEKVGDLALEENVPIVLDVSSFLDEDDANDLIYGVARHLFAREKKLKRPFLLVVEEVHEYIPQTGGVDETGQMLIKIGKRGRKHGLGIVGISQRPADVKKDFITQANWLVWHRLTWSNDTKVAGRILSGDYADAIEDLGDGEAFVQADWRPNVERVQFDRKETFDAGATPGLDDFERPELKSVSEDLVDELQNISERQAEREDELARAQERIDRLEDENEELREKLERAREVNIQLSGAEVSLGEVDAQATLDTMDVEQMDVASVRDRLSDAEAAVIKDLQDERDDYAQQVDALESEVEQLEAAVEEQAATIEDQRQQLQAVSDWEDERDAVRDAVGELAERLEVGPGDGQTPSSADHAPRTGETSATDGGSGATSPTETDAEASDQQSASADASTDRKRSFNSRADFVESEVVREALSYAADGSPTGKERLHDLLVELVQQGEAEYATLADAMGLNQSTLRGYMSPIREYGIVTAVETDEGRRKRFALNVDGVEEIRSAVEDHRRLHDLRSGEF